VDSERWERFAFRSDDVVISTPAKCGTSWMQTIVGMLVLDRIDLGRPISTISPWLDMLIYTDEEIFRLLRSRSTAASSRPIHRSMGFHISRWSPTSP
jgi:hypothetical protein